LRSLSLAVASDLGACRHRERSRRRSSASHDWLKALFEERNRMAAECSTIVADRSTDWAGDVKSMMRRVCLLANQFAERRIMRMMASLR